MVLLLVPLFAHADAEAWVEYQADTKTLTFRYDEFKDQINATAKYDLSIDSSSKPGWISDSNTRENVTKVVFTNDFANVRPTNCTHWFWDMVNLSTIEGMEYFNTSKVTDMGYMFYRCVSLTSLDLSHFDTSNVTTMESMFSNMKLTSLDLSKFNTEKVVSMKNMFYYCDNLTDVNVTSFVISRSSTLYGMFDHCKSLIELNLTSFDISGMYNKNGIDRMFRYCTKLRNILVNVWAFSISDWGSELDSFCKDLFSNATSLPNFDRNWTNHLKCKDMSQGGYLNHNGYTPTKWVEYQESTSTLTFHYDRFEGFTDATGKYDFNKGDTVPEWLGKNITKVVFDKEMKKARPTTCYHWFDGMDKLTTIEGINYLNTSEVTNMAGMFEGSSQLDSLDLTGFNTSKVKDMSSMFASCTLLNNIFAADTFVVADNVKGDKMFEGCMGLPVYDYEKVDKTKAIDITLGGYINFTNVATPAWVEYVENTSTLIFHSDKLRACAEGNKTFDFDPSITTNFKKWYDINPETVVISRDFRNVKLQNCTFWFYNKTSLKEIMGMQNLNTSKLTRMDGMFGNCTSLTSLDMTSLDLSGVTNTNDMFLGCSNLKNIYVSANFSLPSRMTSTDMFRDCTQLPNFDSSNVTKDKANYVDGYFTLCRNFTVGDKTYSVYGTDPVCNDNVKIENNELLSSDFIFKFDNSHSASYHRDVTNSWNTLCLPFAFDASSQNGNCKFYGITEVSSDVISVKEVTGEVKAGKPLLVYTTQDSFDVSGEPSTKIVLSPLDDTNMVGTFKRISIKYADYTYFIAKNKFWNSLNTLINTQSQIKVSPYRAYITTSSSSGTKPVSLDISTDNTDDISNIAATVVSDMLHDSQLYDIQGRRLMTPTRGLVIVKKNGITRKMVIK